MPLQPKYAIDSCSLRCPLHPCNHMCGSSTTTLPLVILVKSEKGIQNCSNALYLCPLSQRGTHILKRLYIASKLNFVGIVAETII